MVDLTAEQVRTLRTQAQGLHTRHPREGLLEAVQAVCGVQAQLSSALMLAIRARVSGLAVDDIEAALFNSHRLVRTWTMRGTLHLMRSEDIRWLVALLGSTFIAKGKRRRIELGLDETTSAKGLEAIRVLLSQNQTMTRGEIVVKLAEQGVVLDRRTQAPIHLIC